jgi:hypothetical protein
LDRGEEGEGRKEDTPRDSDVSLTGFENPCKVDEDVGERLALAAGVKMMKYESILTLACESESVVGHEKEDEPLMN